MTTAPFVELRFNPTDLRPQDLLTAGAFLGSPADALEAALSITRAAMVDQMRDEIRGIAAPTHHQLLRIADLAWQLGFWRFRKVSAPIIADAYIRAYRRADAGEVPMSLIYDLADKHAEKIGWYFHETSREALAEGFNSMVNRQVPAKAAADVVLDAYGLTPRQMRGYTRVSQFKTPVSDVLPRPVKAKMREYVDRSFTSRVQKLTTQEEHNIDQQAQQYAWMWLQDKGRLSAKAQKLWITAKDERVCKVCGPLHGKKVLVNQQFKTPQGDFWTPGLHPNCRCVVRLLEMRFSKADWDPDEHPRGGDPENPGRFSAKARSPKPYAEPDRPTLVGLPVIETTETAAPVADISLSAVSDIRPGVLRPLGIADIAAPVDITSPTVDIAPADIAAPTVDILGLLPAASVNTVVSDVTVIPTKKKKLTRYQEIRPLDESYYKVVSGAPGYQQLDQEVFSADRDQVILDAADIREQAINNMMAHHVAGGRVTFKERAGFGMPLEARIPEEEFRNILEVLSQHTTSAPPNDALIEVDFYDPEGDEGDPPVETVGRTVLDIAHAVGVDPDHLAVHVARVDAVHSENVGRGTARRGKIVGHPYDEYEITGEYNIDDWDPEYEEGTGTPVGMDIYVYDPHDPAVGYMEE